MAFVIPLALAAMEAAGSAAAAVGTAAAGTAAAAGGAAATAGSAAASLGAAGITGASAAAGASSALGTASLGLTAAGGLAGAVGQIQAGQAQAAADKYNATMARQNANVAKENATIAGQSGEAQAAIQQQKTRALVGSTKANQAASGIDVNTGSAVSVRTSEAELGGLDALTIRSNAAREAYGYRVQETNYKAQGELDEFAAKNAQEAGWVGGVSTLLGAAGTAGSNFAKYQLTGGFTG